MDINCENTINDWEELNINENLLRGIYAYGFEKPSPIQKKAILPILKKQDIIAQAQSGTGKTGCFVISSLEIINLEENNLQVLIMAPTRELAIQINSVLKNIGTYMKTFTSKLLIGGNNIENDIKLLKKEEFQIIIGCPGRINDMINRKILKLENLKLMIVDEADELLSSGFKDQLNIIFKQLPETINLAFFSATLNPYLENLVNQIMNDPLKIIVKNEQLTLDGIKQYYVLVQDDKDKYECLKDIFSKIIISQTIIFCNSVKRVENLYKAMIEDEFPVTLIHSNLDKLTRTENYQNFISGKNRVLISSDLTARGIDIQQVGIVLNFDIPKFKETYIHRIGRSGRWGRKGKAINFINKKDIIHLKNIEQFYSTSINQLPENF